MFEPNVIIESVLLVSLFCCLPQQVGQVKSMNYRLLEFKNPPQMFYLVFFILQMKKQKPEEISHLLVQHFSHHITS